MYGVYDFAVADFNGDGLNDIAAIAFFTDVTKKIPEKFVLLENQGDGNYKPFALPAANNGRWSRLAAADFDQDGDTDIVLGGMYVSQFNF
ncbi:MAG: FG-GAP repeat domain protein [Candidatus Woesebacteria bacterium GW2011_GWB1_38_8]|uniref:FG-GAP repeat domain protein n=1 Tax=Candidatus Woesebacteria bacterium GW2011_GWB1_38_8 TaxID=1618570 RepID=A0A0G0KVP9_9BACT|nr:MAG: FG-GAP repeat domain protein [Candidatus Woesebacteria bacterium GW2011_GWB1_38_8]